MRNDLVKDYTKLIAEQNVFDDKGNIIQHFEGERYTKDDAFRENILQYSILKGAFSQDLDSLEMVYNTLEKLVNFRNHLIEQRIS